VKTSSIPVILLALISFSLPACDKHEEGTESEHHTIVVTNPKAMDVLVTRQYVCQIHAQRHINVRALQDGYLQAIRIKEGQQVKAGDELFSVIPILYEAKYEAEKAAASLAELELKYAKSLAEKKAVSQKEVALYDAKLAKANAEMILAKRELDFTKVKAPFDGIIDRLHEQQGSLIKERDILTTLSDNSLMWVYFNVPEKDYLEYMTTPVEEKAQQRIELLLAGNRKFPLPGKIGAIEAKFNNETGTVPFRADFPNPDRLLRHGMTGNILVQKPFKNAIVIPQRATYEILERLYVYVVDNDNVAHQREIVKDFELPNIFVIRKGIGVDDKIVFEGVREVRDGEKVEFEYRPPAEILAHQQFHAE
jgi:membrane fusion protein, multidrug efflux system